jgi:hypothetical protein
VKLTAHLHLVPRSKNEWSYNSTPSIRLHGVVLSKSTGTTLLFKCNVCQMTQSTSTFPPPPPLHMLLSYHNGREPTVRSPPVPNSAKLTLGYLLLYKRYKAVRHRIQCTLSHTISPRSTLIFHLRLGLQLGLFLSGFLTNNIRIFHLSHACYLSHLSHSLGLITYCYL